MRKRAGFTLVELLVVIGIIAVLLGILLPAVNRARQQANSLYCMSNLRQIGIAMVNYTQSNNGSYPIYYWNLPGSDYTIPPGYTDWTFLLLPYFGKAGSTGSYSGSDAGGLGAIYKDKDTVDGTYQPAGPSAPFATYSTLTQKNYGVLTWPFHFQPGLVDKNLQCTSGNPGPQDDGEVPYRVGMVKRPSEIIMVADAAQIANEGLSGTGLTGTWMADADLWAIQGGQFQSNLLIYWQNPLAGFMSAASPSELPDAGLNQDWLDYAHMTGTRNQQYKSFGNDLRFRHLNNTQMNALMFDGHVESFHYKHPGNGGSDLQFKNFILDDYRWRDIKWIPGTANHPS